MTTETSLIAPTRFHRPQRRPTAYAVAVCLVTASAGRPETAETERVLRKEIDSELRLAVDRGLAFLTREQRPSGSLSGRVPVAANALAGLAFLAGGYTNRQGPHAETIEKLITSLLEYQKEDGYFDDGQSRMYGHGFATLFLAELYGMTGQLDRRIRDSLKRAIALIGRAQCNDGGWDYFPSRAYAPRMAFGLNLYSGKSDTSITVCQTMALRAARNLGVAVDTEVIAGAKAFIESAQNSDGGFAYRLTDMISEARQSRFPRSAAGVCILLSLGDYNSTKIRKGFDYLERNYRDSGNRFPYYADYYCAQAMFQAGGRYWRSYFPHVRQKLLDSQERDGSWDPSRLGDRVQATAMALIVLEFPYRFLPISER